MKLDKLIKEVKRCYDKKQQAFYAEIPPELGKDILKYLEELKGIKESEVNNAG